MTDSTPRTPPVAAFRTDEGLHAILDLRGNPVLAVAGELDAANADALHRALVAAIDQARISQASQLVLDLAEVSFADSSALSALIRARAYGASHHVELRLRGLQPVVDRVMTLTGLAKVFAIDASTSTPPTPTTSHDQ